MSADDNRNPGAFIDSEEEPSSFEFTPLPSSQGFVSFSDSIPLQPVINDHRALLKLLGFILRKSGKNQEDIALALGTTQQNVWSYLNGKHPRPGLSWFLRFCAACGAQVEVKIK